MGVCILPDGASSAHCNCLEGDQAPETCGFSKTENEGKVCTTSSTKVTISHHDRPISARGVEPSLLHCRLRCRTRLFVPLCLHNHLKTRCIFYVRLSYRVHVTPRINHSIEKESEREERARASCSGRRRAVEWQRREGRTASALAPAPS